LVRRSRTVAATVKVISRTVLPKTGRTRLIVGRRLSRDSHQKLSDGARR